MNDSQKKVLAALAEATSVNPMPLSQIAEKSQLDSIGLNQAISHLLDDAIINKCFVQNHTFAGDLYWPTAKSLQAAKWSSFKINDKVPPPARRTELQQTKQPIAKATTMPATSRSDHIRNTIANNPGIAHDELINKVAISKHPAELKKAAYLIEYVMRQGGFERTKDIRTGSNEIIRRYYTTQAWSERIESAKQVVENTIPTLKQHHDAAPAKQINEPCKPIIKQVDDHIGEANKMMPALQTQEGGSHYKDMKIQPVEFILANNLGFIEGNVVKYVSRWKNKNGVQDLKKARHFLDILIEQQEVA